MDEPFFSIVIPTKNRLHLLKDALQSILLQNFSDYEIIVSDDSDDTKTEKFISNLITKNELLIKYIRPNERMGMQDHFEWATKYSNGKYTLLFPDRSVLFQDALKKIKKAIDENPTIQIVYWPWLLFDEKRNIFCGHSIKGKNYTELKNSKKIIADFLENPENLYNLPRNLNTCYSKEIANQIRNKFGGLFLKLNPDFTFCFLVLSQIDKVLYIKEPLFISQGLAGSMGTKLATSWIKDLSLDDMFKKVPLKAPLSINTFFEDFLRIQELAKGNLSNFQINYPNYVFSFYKELFYKKNLFSKADFINHILKIKQFVNSLDKEVQKEIKRKLKFFWLFKLKSYINCSFLGEYAKGLKWRIDFIRIKGFRGKYRNVLDAAGFKIS